MVTSGQRINCKGLALMETTMNRKDFPGLDLLDEGPDDVPRHLSTNTIDVNVLIDELSTSGSFDLNQVEATSFGRLLQSLPVPTLLIDEAGSVAFANQSWERIHTNYDKMQGHPFSSLFADAQVGKEAHALIDRVFVTRKPEVATAVLEIGKTRIYARMHFRCVRIGPERSIIALVQDLTLERRQFLLIKKHRAELLKAHGELEKRVEHRTAALRDMNRKLLLEIAERKRAEEAFRVSEDKYRLVVENAQEAICVVQGGMFRFLNRSGQELLGCSDKEAYSRPFSEFVHPDDREMVAHRDHSIIAGDQLPDEFSFRAIDRQGGVKSVEANSVVIDWEGKPAILKFLSDITVKLKMEEEQRRVAKLESIGVLAGGIAHDFNNILTVILGNVSLAKMYVGADDKAFERLGEAENACTRAQALTKQLLTFSKGGAPVKKTSSLAKVAQDSCLFALGGSNVRCNFSLPGDLWPADIDEGQIGQVFHNIIINADQAMPQGGVIRVAADNVVVTPDDGLPLEAGRYVRVSVRDQGVGILQEHLSKVFDPYFSTKQKGSGLGLATSYSIVKNHGGLITVESQVGLGTTFHTYLPASEGEMETQERPQPRVTQQKGRILVMDDERSIRNLAAELLRLLGYEAVLAKDGAEAIALNAAARESGRPFDCLILDLTVPGGMGGEEAVRIIRQTDPEVKVIVSSGYSNDPALSNFRTSGFNGVVAKPYGIKELDEAISRLVAKKDHDDHARRR